MTCVGRCHQDDVVFLRADEAAPYGVVVQAMAAARRAGATRLGIVTEEEHRRLPDVPWADLSHDVWVRYRRAGVEVRPPES